jgi:hypothetical protein
VLISADGLAGKAPPEYARVCKIRKVDRARLEPLWYTLAGPAQPEFLALISDHLRQCGTDINACLLGLASTLNHRNLTEDLRRLLQVPVLHLSFLVTDAHEIYYMLYHHGLGAGPTQTFNSLTGSTWTVFGEFTGIEDRVRRINGHWPDSSAQAVRIVRKLFASQIKRSPTITNQPIAILLFSNGKHRWVERGACEEK